MSNLNANLTLPQVRNRTQVTEEGTRPPEQHSLIICEDCKVAKKTNNKDEIHLTQFLREFKKTPTDQMPPERVASLAVSLTRNVEFRELLNDYELHRPDRPGTQELLFNNSVSILVVSMLPSQRVPSHDHGQSSEVLIVISGTLTIRNFKISEDQKLMPDPDTEVGEDGVSLTAKYAQHQILNNSGAPTLSVHFHVPGWRPSK